MQILTVILTVILKILSSILIKININLNSVIRKINDELQELCEKHNLCNGAHLSKNDMNILASNFANDINRTIFKRFFNSGNWSCWEFVHNEQQATVGTLSLQSNDCQSSEQTPLTSYGIDMLMKTRKTYEEALQLGT